MAASMLDELSKDKPAQIDAVLSDLIDRPKFAYVPLEYYDTDRQIAPTLPEYLTRGRLLKILADRQFVTEQEMVFSMGRCLNTPPVNLARLRVPDEVMLLVPREMAKANRLVPVARLDGKLFVAMADPTNVLAVDDLK